MLKEIHTHMVSELQQNARTDHPAPRFDAESDQNVADAVAEHDEDQPGPANQIDQIEE